MTAALSGGSSRAEPIPPAGSAHAKVGVLYPFRLYTHCGADWRTSFDGSYWDLAAPVQSGLGNPFQEGTMTLVAADEAKFDYLLEGGQASITFHRHTLGVPLKPPAGCD